MAGKSLVNKQNTKLVYLLIASKPWKSCWSVPSRYYSNEKSVEKEASHTEQAPSAAESDDLKTLTGNIESLNKEILELKEKNNELLDKYRRSLAESENVRVRLNKQISDAKIFGIQSFCKDLLEVADILGHATKAVPLDQISDNNPHLKNLYEGLTMTNASLMQVFKRHGLEPMNPLNEKFNPNLHEALFQKPDASVAPDTIVEVTKLGYKLHERVIRPALVGVSKS